MDRGEGSREGGREGTLQVRGVAEGVGVERPLNVHLHVDRRRIAGLYIDVCVYRYACMYACTRDCCTDKEIEKNGGEREGSSGKDICGQVSFSASIEDTLGSQHVRRFRGRVDRRDYVGSDRYSQEAWTD